MPISKVQLPNNTTQDVHDSRVVSDAITYVGGAIGSATYTADTAPVKYVEDKNGDVFFPVSHVSGVVNDDGDTLNTILNDYPKFRLCASESEYNAITTKDANTLYLISESSIYDAEISYLQSSGTQYIDTGINTDSDISVEVQIANYGSTWNASPCAFGAITSSSPYVRHYVALGSGTDGWLLCFNTTVNHRSTVKPADGVTSLIKVDAVNKKFYVDGTERSSLSSSTFDVGQNFLLFARGGVLAYSSVRIYYAKLWDGANLVRDFIPVRVGATGYMYDRVSGELFGNSGTGAFTLGADL